MIGAPAVHTWQRERFFCHDNIKNLTLEIPLKKLWHCPDFNIGTSFFDEKIFAVLP